MLNARVYPSPPRPQHLCLEFSHSQDNLTKGVSHDCTSYFLFVLPVKLLPNLRAKLCMTEESHHLVVVLKRGGPIISS